MSFWSLVLFFQLVLAVVVNCQISSASPALVMHPPSYSTALLGQTVRMTCVGYGVPTPTISWTKANGNIVAMSQTPNSGVKIYTQTLSVNGTDFAVSVLELCGITADFTDQYGCSASNGVIGDGVAPSTRQFFLSVTLAPLQPPAMVVYPPANSTSEYGATLEMVCIAYGNPLPAISWTKSGCSNISASSNANIYTEIVTYGEVSFRKSVLQLCGVSMTDADWYSCTASNGIDGAGLSASSQSWQLNVLPPPPPSSSPMPSSSMMTSSMMSSMMSSVMPSQSPPLVTGGLSGDRESAFIAVMLIEAIIVIVLIVAVVGVSIFSYRYVKSKENLDIPRPPRDPYVDRMDVSNPLHAEGGFDENDVTNSMTYADLAKRVEAEDKQGLVN